MTNCNASQSFTILLRDSGPVQVRSSKVINNIASFGGFITYQKFSNNTTIPDIDSTTTIENNRAIVAGGVIFINDTSITDKSKWNFARINDGNTALSGNFHATRPTKLRVAPSVWVLRMVYFNITVDLLDAFDNIIKNFTGSVRAQVEEMSERSATVDYDSSGSTKITLLFTSTSQSSVKWRVCDTHIPTICATFDTQPTQACAPGFQKVNRVLLFS